MPSFTAGVNAATSAQNANTAAIRAQLEAQQADLDAKKQGKLEDQQQKTIEAIAADAEARIGELDEKVLIGELDSAFMGIANGDYDDIQDFMADPDNRQLLATMPSITEAFGDSIRSVRKFNPNDENDVDARNNLALSMFDNQYGYDELPENQKKFVDEHLSIVDLEGGGSKAIRSDEFLLLMGSPERRAKARRMIDSNNSEIARISREAEEQKLRVLDPSYTGADKGKSATDIAASAANAYKKLIDSKADPQLISSIMTTLGYDINQEGVREQLEALAAGEKADTDLTIEKITALQTEGEQLEAFNSVGANSGYGESAGALVKELIDAGTHTVESGKLIKKPAKAESTPARIQYLAKAGDTVANFTQKLQSEKTVDGEPATWDNYTKWPKALQDEAALKADEYDTLTESKPPTDTMKRDLATLNQTLFASGRFVREGEESTTGPVDSAVNILKTYLEIPDQDRRIEKSHELAGILVAASLDERTSKYLFQRVANVFGSDYGQSFESALGGAELFLNTQKAKVDSIRNETTNPFTRARLEFYSSQIDSALKLARNRLQLDDSTTESPELQDENFG